MINLTQQYLPQSRALIDILWRVQVNKEGNTDCQVQSMINLFTEVRVCLTDSHHETRLIPGRTEEVASQCCLLEEENVTAGRQPPGGRTVDCGHWHERRITSSITTETSHPSSSDTFTQHSQGDSQTEDVLQIRTSLSSRSFTYRAEGFLLPCPQSLWSNYCKIREYR